MLFLKKKSVLLLLRRSAASVRAKVCVGDSDRPHHDVVRGRAAGERLKNGHTGRGARRTWNILNKGWSCDDTSSAARCATWLGGTRRVEGGGAEKTCLSPLPCFPRQESAVLSRKVTRGHKRVARVGSTYHEERRTCCDNDAQSEPSTRPLPLLAPCSVAVGGGPTFPPSFPSTGKALPLASDLVALQPHWFERSG